MRKSRAFKPSRSPDKLLSEVTRRGPHRVLRGDLGIVGMPGQVFAPNSGRGLPAVAFGHAWRADHRRYRDLLWHLASWGFVVVAPDGNSGVLASDAGHAADLRAALGIVSHVTLGLGAVTVDPDRIGLAGHGFGASAAVLAAADEQILGQPAPAVTGVAALFPAPTTSILRPAAELVRAPGLIVAGAAELDTIDANALPLAKVCGGDVVLRTVSKGSAVGLLERRTIGSYLGVSNGADRGLHALVRAVCTGFLLHTVAGDREYQAFADPAATFKRLGVVDLDHPPVTEVDPISRLLGAKPHKRRALKH
ncbi:dienelactone hydrolase family protein [Gordonia rhizosphera]|uniref:dienelactone hydrolase family protein n=1 Tax=Gordonia rhizosphera TaxID=83341 RepID=UPI0002EFE71E|nr:alpha/beta hydrolase [Gordonia rhizosphera]